MLHRDKAVEQSLEKIRRAPDSRWETLTAEERAGLKTVISEIWENCERGRFEQYCFSTMTYADILRLVDLGNDMRARHREICDARADVESILLPCTPGGRPL